MTVISGRAGVDMVLVMVVMSMVVMDTSIEHVRVVILVHVMGVILATHWGIMASGLVGIVILPTIFGLCSLYCL